MLMAKILALRGTAVLVQPAVEAGRGSCPAGGGKDDEGGGGHNRQKNADDA